MVLDLSGALFIPAYRALIVADLHLEKGTSGARRGIFLPPYDSQRTLANLARAVEKFTPEKLILLGDSFHDSQAAYRLSEDSRDSLLKIGQQCELIWVTGNHDPEIPKTIADQCVPELIYANIHFNHIPQLNANLPQMSGHLHPAVIVKGRGRILRRRCFVSDGERMILPAFGAYTGGLNINDQAFDGLFNVSRRTTHIIGDQGIFSLPALIRRR